MSSEPELRVEVVMRPEDRTVSGEIRSGDGANAKYIGWIGLLAALQGLTGDDARTNEGQER